MEEKEKKYALDIIFDAIPFIVTVCAFSLTVYLHFHNEIKIEDKIPEKLGFATVTTPAFCMGAVALGHTLVKYHGNKYDRLCLVTEDVSQQWRNILSQWWTVVPVAEYRPGIKFRRSWTKLRLWTFTEYKKIVYLDTDTLVFGPIDRLFDYPELSCTPDISPPQICNTGVLVLEPRPGVFADMQRASFNPSLRQGVGDQGFINAYFGKYYPLPPKYNSPRIQTLRFGQALKVNRTKVVHFVCKKPWKCGREGVDKCGCGHYELNTVWWNTFDEACKNHSCLETWKE